MEEGLKKQKGLRLFHWTVDVATIIALLLQCFNITASWTRYIAGVVILLFLLSIVISVVTKKTTFKRTELIKLTKKRMINSTGKVVMFGGDLSWTDDYIDVITKLTNNSQVVEIIFPLEKIANSKGSVRDRFQKNVTALKKAGAVVYASKEDYHLRCTLIDIEPGRENEDLCVISSKRIYTDEKELNKNKYQTNVLEYKKADERALCNSFYRNYCLIKQICRKY